MPHMLAFGGDGGIIMRIAGGYFIPEMPPHLMELLTEIVHRLIAIEEKLGGEEE